MSSPGRHLETSHGHRVSLLWRLDVHKKTVVACRIVPGPDGQPHKEIATFGTTTHELLRLADWLAEAIRLFQMV